VAFVSVACRTWLGYLYFAMVLNVADRLHV